MELCREDEYDFRSDYCVGDVVVAAVDHPEDCTKVLRGCTGTVRKVSQQSVLVEWNVEPGLPLHNGSGTLSTEKGWFIHFLYRGHIQLLRDTVYKIEDVCDLFD